MSNLRYHEIVETEHHILNPFTPEKLAQVGEICRLQPGQRVLDLACGKAELLATWAQRYGISGIGVDISPVMLAGARARVAELGVADQVTLIEGDAGAYHPTERFDVVACVGATWIGGGLVGTLRQMRLALAEDGLLVVGEPYLVDQPPAEVVGGLGFGADEFVSLPGTLDRFEEAGAELVEMVLANPDSWDRYEAAQWWAANRWVRANPDHPEAAWIRDTTAQRRRDYLAYRRRYLGWGVFVLRA